MIASLTGTLTFVDEDRIGDFPYMIAATPVRVGGRHAVLTVVFTTVLIGGARAVFYYTFDNAYHKDTVLAVGDPGSPLAAAVLEMIRTTRD